MSSGAVAEAAEALICGRSKMSRTEKLDVRGILISSNLEGEVNEIWRISLAREKNLLNIFPTNRCASIFSCRD